MTLYTTMDSPLGEPLLVGEESGTTEGGTALASLSVPGQKHGMFVQDGWIEKPEAFTAIVAQLRAYFDGGLTVFDLEYVTSGSAFQRQVWAAVESIPYGATLTYGDLARQIGAPAAVRAVGAAIGANPLMVVRPCHRVVGAGGAPTGYAGGLQRKQQLLDLEHAGQLA
ncbi:methylated-DNA--[protein]-cysteine S-methyltransferase [Streptomyces sp. MI02-2A]|uniref:methylated-DNA--[protein]-cysteine S-methyltransferase n=1 Tax=Streptomyces sp. MI02-2A TaxID=3028688 RepID=UPI0029BE4A73|nr:methylated-DNA--[protein]-cysteine S-methyltransferase [Streptomyces sp. MI02-2A]MDX3263755.1 methylated-DNA--[protein]-cysteine S-methyltransferase [Streptomyces sp. MI02-2A]